jgi:hypothetical protein
MLKQLRTVDAMVPRGWISQSQYCMPGVIGYRKESWLPRRQLRAQQALRKNTTPSSDILVM